MTFGTLPFKNKFVASKSEKKKKERDYIRRIIIDDKREPEKKPQSKPTNRVLWKRPNSRQRRSRKVFGIVIGKRSLNLQLRRSCDFDVCGVDLGADDLKRRTRETNVSVNEKVDKPTNIQSNKLADEQTE